MKYKLLAADMDGTLLNDKSEITEKTKTAVLKAIEAGVLFVTATGRALSGVEFINALFDKDLPFITHNGAMVCMGKSRKVLVNKHLGFDLAKEVFDLGVAYEIPVVVWTGKKLWVSRECEDTRFYRGIANTDMSVITDIYELKDAGGVSKLLWIDSPGNISRYHREMSERFGGRLNCYPSRPIFLEFFSIDADKGIALAEIGRIYEIDRSEMVAVGDSYNDIAMLKYAGFGVAMENSPDEIKAVCGHVTLSNNNDGVAAVIDEYIL